MGLVAMLATKGVARGACPATSVAEGNAHSLALDLDGTAWAWGAGDRGQLGNGGTADATKPGHVLGLGALAAVAAGGQHSLAVQSAGGVKSWGANQSGQLGDGTTTDRLTPVAVSAITAATAAAGGRAHSLALLSSGTVKGWGANQGGQLGDGTTTGHTTPVAVTGLTGVTAIAAGADHSLALKNDGTVWGWGANARGQVGDGSTTDRSTPQQVTSLSSVVAIAAGGDHSLAVKSDGTVWSWGANASGELGDGSTTDRATPVAVTGLTAVAEVAAGDYHSLARKTDGSTWAWGSNASGQLGAGPGAGNATAPVRVATSDTAARLAAGGSSSLLATTSRVVHSFGANARGQLGIGTTVIANRPAKIWYLLTCTECACRGVLEYVVGYANGNANAVYAFVNGLGYATVVGQIPTPTPTALQLGAYIVHLQSTGNEAAFYAACDANPNVRYRERDCPRFALAGACDPTFPQDPGFAKGNNDCDFPPAHPDEKYQEPLKRALFPVGWDVVARYAGPGLPRTPRVAVLDTGANFDHPDLSAQGLILDEMDFVNGYYDSSTPGLFSWHNDADGAVDDHKQRHGTMMAGIIGAATDTPDQGIAGAACFACPRQSTANSVGLFIYKVLDAEAVGKPSQVALGITYAALRGAEVLNLSLGSSMDSKVVRDACVTARKSGAVLFAAAGNDNGHWVYYPAAYGNVFGVGATAYDGPPEQPVHRADFSNHGAGVDLYAPGESILSTGDLPYLGPTETNYAYGTGTSYSTAYVAAAAVLALSIRPPGYCAYTLEATLRSSGIQFEPPVLGDPAKRELNVSNLLATLPFSPTTCPIPPPDVLPGTPPGPEEFGGGGMVGMPIIPSGIR